MSSQQLPQFSVDRYVVIHVATTCDEHGVYVTKDSAEVIELGWILVDANSMEELIHESVLVKPINTPITPLCTSLTTLTWENVRTAGTFRDAITRFDQFVTEHLTSKNLDFVFVTLDAWDLRVQLPREARDKAVVLPPYLQHSRTFDLRTEYQRWQQHHPESLPFGPSMLANICAALEVEPVQSSAPIKHNLPFHLQALAPASPRRAMEEAVTLARVLRGLIRKSQPRQEHPDVLTRPMDARADVRAFLSERSKVLHMSGLPHDTTQSELESWFTQFGGRPIAFWTLRTPEQHKPTGTGFAVFSSHEEAAESLCMNGRALNEKAIEVSPSSSRVLDRAQDILTPFPPSKNRPRPGDWTCPSCGFSNFQRRTACFRCSFPAMGSGPQEMGAPGGGGGPGGYGYGYGPPHMMGPPPHHGGHHGHMGHGGRMGGSGAVPFRAGDWKCGNEVCGYHNFAKNVCCLRCGASRAGAAVVADSGYPGPGSSMDNASQYSMSQGSMAGTPGPGPGPFPSGGGGSFSSGAGAYNQHFGGPPSHFLPSGIGGGAGGYPSSLNTQGFGPAPGSHSAGPFDSRAAEAAFQSATNGPASAGGSNNFYNNGGNNNAGSENDPFAFLSSGMGGLSVSGNDARQNGGSGPSKSPA
ncbi:putative RNA-binding protein-like protein [Hapsidospora chrysogenum ATCC 11550]|uniref:Putative RNA-binding protein-like protein n=1 Tax=Hapsidospora chrysogenum (strain ATCC 11550 / CBS 779.69 / DSM 880 / IAM 14645 / JCM 23072 / IMI 49137) TaxID=857340 RepID=A0A086TDY2_HAPC1|nr:putative RNA-binding protein-like protein [Hapsidospora chrysogenum ATCC 11550]